MYCVSTKMVLLVPKKELLEPHLPKPLEGLISKDVWAYILELNRSVYNDTNYSLRAENVIDICQDFLGFVLQDNLKAPLFIAIKCDSSFSIAWMLQKKGLLCDWGAVVALEQTSGRGQMRREWQSYMGNLHVSYILPTTNMALSNSGSAGQSVFMHEAASVFTSLLLLNAFKKLGLELKLKWPNDLSILIDNKDKTKPRTAAKLGGLLLEESDGVVIAGLGINSVVAPDNNRMREGAALPATTLPNYMSAYNPITLWLALVENQILIYEIGFGRASTETLLKIAENSLLWLNSQVRIKDAHFLESYEHLNTEESFRNPLPVSPYGRDDFSISGHAARSVANRLGDGESQVYGQILGLSANGGLRVFVNETAFTFKEKILCSGSISCIE